MTTELPMKSEKPFTKREPLTHFLTLPIGHHPALRDTFTQISAAFLQSSPAIPGLHESILIKPGGLHLTLGVLSLASLGSPVRSRGRLTPGVKSTPASSVPEYVSENSASVTRAETSTTPRHSVDDALELLRTLETPIKNMLTDYGSLKVPLDYIDVMRSRPNHKLDESHVMWAGPDLRSEAGKLLKTVCDLVNSTFKNAGMLKDDRPLKLHCTLINTLHRKDKSTINQKNSRWGNKRRIPFSFSALLSSSAYKQIAISRTTEAGPSMNPNVGPHRVNLGTWTVDEVQLCEMGSKDANGVYNSVGSISLR